MTDSRYHRVALETSLKPFAADLTPAGIDRTCRRLWANWTDLLDRCDEICVLLWVGDGSEILEWHGDLDEPVVWAQSIGFCNYGRPGVYPPENRHYRINAALPFMDDPPELRFADLRTIIERLRATARALLDREVLVGATIDPGPEFVESPFKYERHEEVLTVGGLDRMRMMHFMTHQCALKADERAYGGFPDGIPDGTPFGTFLGEQFAAARRDLGFDYLWLSNGLGYTHFPWGYRGELFDGERFDAEAADAQRDRANRFWTDLREACGDAPFEVRGTNFTVGMDIASDGCSHADVARIGRLVRPPCNPPWGSRALGLEMASYLSRIAKTPSARLPFRFYLNDPWFVSSPWYDYYAREPFDIYVPMSAGRLGEDGRVETPTDLSLLTIDTEKGELLRGQAIEATPHLLRALDERADAAGPVVWVYPFDEYDALLKCCPELLGLCFFHDWFFCRAVTAGLPANTVCSSDRFAALARAGRLPDAVYVAPAPLRNFSYAAALLDHVATGGKALLYGPLDGADEALLAALGVSLADQALEGDFAAEVRLAQDRFAAAVQPSAAPDATLEAVGMASAPAGTPRAAGGDRPLRHRAIIGGGGLRATCDDDDGEVRVLLRQDGQTRAYAVSRGLAGGGRLAWIRGSCCFDPSGSRLEPAWDPPADCLLPDDWPRRLLAEFGLDIAQDRADAACPPANVFIKRRRGAWIFVGHKPDTSVRFRVRTDDGAPAYAESETPLHNGYAGECFGKSFHSEVRAFVKMPGGTVKVKELPVPVGAERHFSLAGLAAATVTLYPDPVALADGRVRLTSIIAGDDPVPHQTDSRRGTVTVTDYTGTLYVVW